MSFTVNVSRRGFLGTSGGLVLGFVIQPRSTSAQFLMPPMPANLMNPPPAGKPNSYIRIGTDDSVTFLIPRSEMGSGPTTACSQMLGEELECDWSKVRFEFAPVDPDSYGVQTTVGSLAMRSTWDPLRRAGAEAREILILAAAQQWNVTPAQCRAENGAVINTTTNAKLTYGALAQAASKMPVPKDVKLKGASEYKIIGKPVKRLDTRDKVTAKAQYGIDARPDGVKYASVARCPVYGGKVVSFDASKTKAVPGFRDVVQVPSGIAVIADNTWAAMQGRKALQVVWDEAGNGAVSSATIKKMFEDRTATGANPGQAKKIGDANAALAKATKKVEAIYESPFLAHATMEPMNCTIHARPNGTAEAWVSTQSPTTCRKVISDVLGIPADKITFHTLFCGGGYGRRGEGAMMHVYEAAEVAKRVDAPVKVTWSREEDIQHDMYRPPALARMAGAVDGEGWPAVFKASLACPVTLMLNKGIDGTAVNGLSDILYTFPDCLVEYHASNTHIPVSFWRSPGASSNNFIAEGFFDELCAAGGKDPVEARRRLLQKSPRMLATLNLAAEKAGWGKPLPAGRARGVAILEHVTSFTAQVAEVSVERGRVRVHKVVCAIDAGMVVNPHILKQQAEGGIIHGLSAALKHAITIDKGRVVQANFDTFDMIRMDETPEIEVHIVPSSERPGGAGELTNPTIIPAVVNAIFAATGKRIRSVPVRAADLA